MSCVRVLGHMTWPEVKASAEGGALLFLPVGSTEAHGPHLPLETDVIIASEVAQRAAAQLAKSGVEVLLAPALTYAVTDYARPFPGTISLRAQTAAAVVEDVIRGLLAHGLSRIAIINGHLEPAHVRILRDLVSTLNDEAGKTVLCFADNTRRRWVPTLSEEFQGGDCHAGEYETSLVLAAHPELVREEARAALAPVEIRLVEKMKAGASTFPEMGATDGYCGDPAAASRAHGEDQYAALVTMVLTEIQETFGLPK